MLRVSGTGPLRAPATALRVVDDGDPPEIRDELEELNLRIFQPVFRYIRNELGATVFGRALREVGIDPVQIQRSDAWISVATAERLLVWLRRNVDGDAEFMRASAYEMRKVYGPMSLVFRLLTVRGGYQALTSNAHLATKVGKFDLVATTRTSARIRYTSTASESRLMCLSRQAQQKAMPGIWWGTSPAAVEEHSCLAHGDGACEYTVHWREAPRMWGPIAGTTVGLLAAGVWLAKDLAVPGGLMAVSFVVIGLLIGLAWEHRRLVAGYNKLAASMTEESEAMVGEHARAVDEAFALHERERRWSAHLEGTLATRRARLDQVLNQFGGEDRETKLRTLSHDLSNPLTVLTTMLASLAEDPSRSTEDSNVLDATLAATEQLRRLVRELSLIARADEAAQVIARDVVEVEPLTSRVRRQLTATLVNRDIRPSVFKTREAPPVVITDALALERVVDNILTNTCKYTERGSIVVEVSGTPGYLLLKVSDTGRGITSERLEQVFFGGEADPNPMMGESHGAGLSIVVGLLDQIGGRLEIMSKPDEGTTIWVYVPVEPPADAAESGERGGGTQERFRRVVRIRPRR